MNIETARQLTAMTNDFYARQAASFSATRDHPWNGWKTCLPHIVSLMEADHPSLTVLDLACGNLRFRDFLHTCFPTIALRYCGVDKTAAMAPTDGQIQTLDIMEALFRGDLADDLLDPPADLSVCFGFLHHVPLQSMRRHLLKDLVSKTRSEGLVTVTAWQFARDDTMRAKAEATTSAAIRELNLADLGAGDYILGWQGDDEARRYCHSFTETEIDDLISGIDGAAELITRFRADGKTGAMNTYLVFRVV